MALKRIDKTNPSSNVIVAKLVFLTVLCAVGFIMSTYFKKPENQEKTNSTQNSSSSNTPTTEPIGVVKGILDEVAIAPFTTKTEEVKNQLAAETAVYINKQASDASNIFNDLVYQNALKPIVDQIDKLPADQQARLRSQVCK